MLDRALASDPSKHYDDAATFATDLAAALGVPLSTSGPFGANTPVGGRSTPALPWPPPAPVWQRRSAILALAVTALVIGTALVLRRDRASTNDAATSATSAATATHRLAVLPFENLGRPEDGYVVDGLTDEIRGKLTGTVRTEPAGEGKPARVRVAPELVELTGTQAPTSRWTQTLDATMADIFGMQADIAGSVAGAMNVALAGGTRAQLAEVPTRNPAAYLQHQLARIYIMTGERAKALDVLEPLLRGPYYVSPAWLRIDPTFGPLGGEARFERLASAPPVVFGR